MKQNKIETEQPHLSFFRLKERGWTQSIVKTLLGEADKYVPNPHYKSASPMRLWLESRVIEAEKHPDFLTFVTKAKNRANGVKQAADAKREALKLTASLCVVTVKHYDRNKLTKLACNNYNKIHSWDSEAKYADPKYSDEAFLARITVNFLRHSASNYEDLIQKLTGKIGANEALREIYIASGDAIAQAYPHLQLAVQAQRTRWLEDFERASAYATH